MPGGAPADGPAEAQRHRPGQVAQLAPGQRRGEQDVDVAAAARRDVGNTPAAEARHEPRDRSCGGADLRRGIAVPRPRDGSRSRASIRPVPVAGS